MGLHFKHNMLRFLHPHYFILTEARLFISHLYDVQVSAGWHLHVACLCGTVQEHFLRVQCHESSQGVACVQGVVSQTHHRNWTHTALVHGEFPATCTIKADSRGFIIWPLDSLSIKREDRIF